MKRPLPMMLILLRDVFVGFLPVGNYLIFYRPIENGAETARVIHSARDYGPELF